MRLRRIALGVAALALIAACSTGSITTPSVTQSWSMYRGDLARDGHPAAATLGASAAANLRLGWHTSVGGAVDGTPAVVGGVVVVATDGGHVEALTAATGAVAWEVDGLGAIDGSPTVDGDLVIVGSLTGHVYALRLAHGDRVWSWDAPGVKPAIWSSPAVFAGKVVIGIGSQYGDSPLEPGRVAALDESTGRQLWVQCVEVDCAAGGGVWSTPAIDAAGRVFVGLGNPDDGVLAFDPATGRRIWMTSLHADAGRDLDVGATPIVLQLAQREAIAVGSDGGVFEVLDANSGVKIWSRFLVAGSAVHGFIASPGYDGAALYVASASTPTGMFALDPATGGIRWEQVTDLPVYSAPAVGVGVVVFGTGDVFGDQHLGAMIALSTVDGSRLWSYDVKSPVFSAPAMAGSSVFVGTAGGDVLAFSP